MEFPLYFKAKFFQTSSLSEKIKQVFETNVKCKTIKIEHFRPNLSTSIILSEKQMYVLSV